MNLEAEKYRSFSLVREMAETADVIRRFDCAQAADAAREIAETGKLLLTGEGSSRLFPAKSSIAHARRLGWPLVLHTEAGRQAAEYDLGGWAVFAASNSGKTAEVIELYGQLEKQGVGPRFSLTANPDTPLESLATRGFVLSCGKEEAVAATKSVVEQALFYRALLEQAAGNASIHRRLAGLADAFEAALSAPIEAQLVERMARAPVVYWAGRNDGVAEELTLKTNEITRKPADYLEGTYAVHGIEEVMSAEDVIVWVDPYEGSEAKFAAELVEKIGLAIVAIADRQTRFPTIRVPAAGDLAPFVQIAAGWNLLVETGLALGVDLDKPQRARKVGNEWSGE